MVELVDTRDLKSLGSFCRAGSSPAPGTKIEFFIFIYFEIYKYEKFGDIAKWAKGQKPGKRF